MVVNIKGLRQKASSKCSCGQPASDGSVFCSTCKAEVNRKNVITLKNEDRRYQKEVMAKKKGKKK
ncbi:hypothetical protein A2291_01180 [candidate division WOR-1 bacterium RIFOXYB2_FULL_42_35]|uniref:Uncharacterized protein n=1 Tax=candidate division WOR-1 bacterium RIFOXYC2_FULL_41_25 TaxID=1802586 RepID=A0A1F4TL30_UNCSA|nr:MAG: hypothetical protein A2247_04605 [candidate division WOR-1 bacterium RIFOXYA2_FULL_41_14]OGC22922.1 MAG: hypothetical protein A2291_01180 [candidate division WOR-1 bacterium RIFOXYB2_FULL_42_35]OGC33404.1 MAG: hypothetical protein A2462_06570 [candidate division WOR-1 bacterium RIFOXYC2_FULL_41_25]OGC43461.1 MAG: hypothetical protein A2548_06725 [candidate division WOR-1 bacterium RIFOXYD2_FULL_41_8]